MIATTAIANVDTLNWEEEVASLLDSLSSAQEELLQVLDEKRQFLEVADRDGLARLQSRESELILRLQECTQRRAALLSAASSQGLPADSIEQLTQTLPEKQRVNLGEQAKTVKDRVRLLQHQSLTNWVLAQRALLHVSQLLEIIATGGRLQPTYGKGDSVFNRGSLLNDVA